MISMTFDDYTELDDKIASLPKLNENYGLEEKDLKRIEADPDRYYRYVMYLLNQPYYEVNAKEHKFDNKDALPQNEVTERLNALIRDHVDITD